MCFFGDFLYFLAWNLSSKILAFVLFSAWLNYFNFHKNMRSNFFRWISIFFSLSLLNKYLKRNLHIQWPNNATQMQHKWDSRSKLKWIELKKKKKRNVCVHEFTNHAHIHDLPQNYFVYCNMPVIWFLLMNERLNEWMNGRKNGNSIRII